MEPLGFVVSCTSDDNPKVKIYECKVYAVVMLKNGKVRFRLYNKFGNFPTYALAKQIAKQYGVDRGWPFAAHLKHNRVVPGFIYKWYFKNPPVKPI